MFIFPLVQQDTKDFLINFIWIDGKDLKNAKIIGGGPGYDYVQLFCVSWQKEINYAIIIFGTKSEPNSSFQLGSTPIGLFFGLIAIALWGQLGGKHMEI